LAERDEIARRYAEWEITGEPEIRGEGNGAHSFNPMRRTHRTDAGNIMQAPTLRDGERYLVLLFLRRYVTYCARRRRYAQMEGAARLFRRVRSEASRPVGGNVWW
jgi:hypothetical protein